MTVKVPALWNIITYFKHLQIRIIRAYEIRVSMGPDNLIHDIRKVLFAFFTLDHVVESEKNGKAYSIWNTEKGENPRVICATKRVPSPIP